MNTTNNQDHVYKATKEFREKLIEIIVKEFGLSGDQKKLLSENKVSADTLKQSSQFNYYREQCEWLDSALDLYDDVTKAINTRDDIVKNKQDTQTANETMIKACNVSISKNKHKFSNTYLLETVFNFLQNAAVALNLCKRSIDRQEMINKVEQEYNNNITLKK